MYLVIWAVVINCQFSWGLSIFQLKWCIFLQFLTSDGPDNTFFLTLRYESTMYYCVFGALVITNDIQPEMQDRSQCKIKMLIGWCPLQKWSSNITIIKDIKTTVHCKIKMKVHNDATDSCSFVNKHHFINIQFITHVKKKMSSIHLYYKK